MSLNLSQVAQLLDEQAQLTQHLRALDSEKMLVIQRRSSVHRKLASCLAAMDGDDAETAVYREQIRNILVAYEGGSRM